MLKTSSYQNSGGQAVFQELRDLFPLLTVAMILLVFAILSLVFEGSKSKPIVRNKDLLLKASTFSQ